MHCDEAEQGNGVSVSPESGCRSAVNSTILEYYKRFGRKRDLEQYFSLSTAQSEIRDPRSLFWRRMKAQNDSSDSGGKRSDSSTEVCRISIKCSVPELSSTKEADTKVTADSESPPIITEDAQAQADAATSAHSDNESVKTDDNLSHKSLDGTFDTSMNKPFSPTSSVTSQRKLEWDSLADVGYANESERKTSGSSLSTLERLALQQQLSNDTKQSIGPPTSHSTPVDENENKNKHKKGTKKTKVSNRDLDRVEFNIPQSSGANPISVNLTKHISFNVENNGAVTVSNVKKDISVSPEKVVEAQASHTNMDKQIQTTLTKTPEKSSSSVERPKTLYAPVLINLNTLKKRSRRRKFRAVKRRIKNKKKIEDKENIPVQEKSGEQVSEAESFEYMPGHMYNQNKMINKDNAQDNTAGNKSSLESSAFTTDSSKTSKHSFTKDLDKSISFLKSTLENKYDDGNLKKKLIKDLIHRLVKSKYRDDDSGTDFLSGMSFSSKKLGLGDSNHTTTSTSDNTGEETKLMRPKKSILRVDKFNIHPVASTSQSVPNLPTASISEKPVASNLVKVATNSTTESDVSSKGRVSDTPLKTSSEELYQKYLDALKREEAYKKHLRDKELFLRQKLVCSENALKFPSQIDAKSSGRIKDLMRDLTRNNYDDGSGDASKLEGGSNSTSTQGNIPQRRDYQRSHSVFTLSSGNSDYQTKNSPKKKGQSDKDSKPGPSKVQHYCCCPYHTNKSGVTESCSQFNVKCQGHEGLKPISRNPSSSRNVVCFCSGTSHNLPGSNSKSNTVAVQCEGLACQSELKLKDSESSQSTEIRCRNLEQESQNVTTKASQTSFNFDLNMESKSSERSLQSCGNRNTPSCGINEPRKHVVIHEATRCLQTEISICPKISEPVLADAVFIKDDDCSAVICEQYRAVSKHSSENDASIKREQSEVQMCASQEGRKSPANSCVSKPTQSRDEITEAEPLNAKEGFYSLPIRGTNMTLFVSLDSSGVRKVCGPSCSRLNQGTVSEANVGKSSSSTQSDLNLKDSRPQTYPRHVQLSENRTLLRSNTDTAILQGIRKDNSQKVKVDDVNVVKNAPTERKCQSVGTTNEAQSTEAISNPSLCRSNRAHVGIMCGCGCLQETINCTEEHKKDNNAKTVETGTCAPNEIVNLRKPVLYSCGCRQETITFCNNYKEQQKDTETQSLRTITEDSSATGTKEMCGSGSLKELSQCSSSFSSVKKDIPRKNDNSSERNAVCGFGSHKETVSPKSYTGKIKLSETSIENAVMCACGCLKKLAQCTASCLMSSENTKKVNPENPSIENKGSVTIDKKSRVTKVLCGCGCGKELSQCSPACENKKQTVAPKKYCKSAEAITCHCGCKKEASSCSESCPEKSKTSVSESSCTTKEKEIFTKPNIVSTVVCTCGCEKDITNCGNTCAEKKRSAPENESIKKDTPPSLNDKIMTNESCDCSCGKQLSECGKSCAIVKQAIEAKKSINAGTETETSCGDSNNKREFGLSKSSSDCNSSGEFKKKTVLSSPSAQSGDGNRKTTKPAIKNLTTVHKDVNTEIRKVTQATSPRLDYDNEGIQRYLRINTDEETDESRDKSKRQKSNTPSLVQSRGNNTSNINKPETKTDYSGSDIPNTNNNNVSDELTSKDPVLNMIHDITRRYAKTTEKHQRKKCFQEIITVLKYLLDTDESTDADCGKASESYSAPMIKGCGTNNEDSLKVQTNSCGVPIKPTVDKGVQSCSKSESSESPVSTEMPTTSSDSATCKILRKIRRECDRYHQKRCKCSSGIKCEGSSSTSINCDQCSRVHHCSCKVARCKGCRSKYTMERMRKKCFAYNLIIQTSDSLISEEPVCGAKKSPLRNIIVKVPPKCQRKPVDYSPCREPKEAPVCSPRCHGQRSKSLPNECQKSSDDLNSFTVRDYLERNRPDFVDNCSKRQDCLKSINEKRELQRNLQRQLLSLQLAKQPSLKSLTEAQLRRIAKDLGIDPRRKIVPPKFTSEREMKLHSERIYKSLPEVVKKKEDKRKENIKKTNLLMADIFKKNLQKKTLRGAVNLSNYNKIINI